MRKTSGALLVIGSMLIAACATVSPDDLNARYNHRDPDTLLAKSSPDSSTSDDDAGLTVASDNAGREPRPVPLETHPSACVFDTTDLDVECGYIEIPAQADSTANPVKLTFARFRSHAANPAPDPVIYLHGGPGGNILAIAHLFVADVVDPFTAERDVILYDQRGAGESSAFPSCDNVYTLDSLFFGSAQLHADLVARYTAAIASCGAELSKDPTIDLSEANSEVHADDFIDLLRALDFDNVNIYGSSYGTRLAQTIMRDHPEPVRSVILSGIYPLEENLIGAVPAAFEAALSSVFSACVADSLCGGELPDPWSTFEAAVDSLDASPLTVEIPLDEYTTFRSRFAGDDLINGFHGLLYSVGGAAMIPDTLIDFEAGDFSRLERIAKDGFIDIGDVASYLAVQCREEVPFLTAAELERAAATATPYDRVNLPPGLLGAAVVEICAAWTSIGTASSIENQAVTWEAPTLVLAGGIDPITPPWWATDLAARLPNAALALSADRGHDSDEGPCAQGLMSQFVDDLDPTLDTSCTREFSMPYLNNLPVKLVGEFDIDWSTSSFDVDPTSGDDWIDIDVPEWPADYYFDEDAYWRTLDILDPAVFIVRTGKLDLAELYWYLDVDVSGDFEVAQRPRGIGSEWSRFITDTAGLDMVTYAREGDRPINLSVVASEDEIDQLEKALLIPAVRSASR